MNRTTTIKRRVAALILVAAFLAPTGWLLWGKRSGPQASIDFDVTAIWGGRGVRPGAFHYPRAVKALPNGDLYIADKSGRIQRFDAGGELIGEWRLPAWEKGTPTGIATDLEGRLVIANCHYGNILTYSPDGELLNQFGEPGEGEGLLVWPTDVAVGPEGFYYVCQFGRWTDKICKYDPDGDFVEEWGGFGEGPAEFQRPTGILCDERGRLWVTDSGNHRLQVFERDGTFVKSVGEHGADLGQMSYPYSLAQGPGGSIVVAEYGNNRLQAFSLEGKSLGVIGEPGRDCGQFASPWGVECDGAKTLWVADTLNHRMQRLEIDWPEG